jgi:glycosyltransferase involved in cell wall biosynthesis
LNTYSAPFNDGKLLALAQRLEHVTAVAADVTTLWGSSNSSRSGNGYEIRILGTRFARSPSTLQLRGLAELAREARPDVIHIESEPWQSVAIQAARIARKSRVPFGVQFAENGPMLTGPKGAVRRFVGSRVLARCSYAIGWSTGSTDVALQLSPGIRTATYPGTGVADSLVTQPRRSDHADQWFGSGSTDLPKLAFVGRSAPEKGLDDFLAIADLLAGRTPIRVAIVGGAPSADTAEWLSTRPWAHAHGVLPRPAVTELLQSADVLVAPSRTTRFIKEQFGKAPVEAMALGTPVFAFDCGALREVVGDGGRIVEEGACLQLAQELERYFGGSETARAAIADAARVQARRFTDSALADGLIRLWSGMVERRE